MLARGRRGWTADQRVPFQRSDTAWDRLDVVKWKPTAKHALAVAQEIALSVVFGERGIGTIRHRLPFQVSAMNPAFSLPSALRLRLPMAWQRSGLTQEMRSRVLLSVAAGRTGARMCQPRESQRSASGRLVPSVPMNQPAARHELVRRAGHVEEPAGRAAGVQRRHVLDRPRRLRGRDGRASRAAAAAIPTVPAAAPVIVAARLAASRTAPAAPASRPHSRVLVITERFVRGLDVIKCPPCCGNAG